MDRQLALQRGFQALEDELGQRQPRGQRRRRARKTGSWRDRGEGDCFTTKKGQVVCEGSAGMSANNRNIRGDEDQKGRKKDKAIRTNRSVMKKYDEEGRVEDLDEEIYFTPLREEGGFVILGRGLNTAGTAMRTKSEGISDNVDTTNTIRVPKAEFNAQYRVMRGFTDPDDKFNDLAPTEYGLQGDADKPKLKEELINLEKKLKKEKRKVKKKGEEEKKKREARIKKVEDDIEEVELKLKPVGQTKTQKLIELQREVRGERLKQEADKEKVDEFVREAQELGGGREGFRRRQRRRELGRQAIRKIRQTRQDRLQREERNEGLVESFERKVRKLERLREQKEELEDADYLSDDEREERLDDIIRLEREVGQELDVRNRKQKEKEEEEEREQQERVAERARVTLELGRRTLRDRRSGIIQSNQYYDEYGLETSRDGRIAPYYREGIDAALQEVGEEKKEEKKEKKEKKKKKPKLSKRGKAEERAKEEQGDDYDEEEWEEEYEEYLERVEEYKENVDEFKEEPLYKRFVEVSNEIQDAGAEVDKLSRVDKSTGVAFKAIQFSDRGRTIELIIPQDQARITYGYDGEIDQLFAIALRADIKKLEDFLATIV